MSQTDPRAEIRKLIAENADDINANLYAMMDRNIEDLAAAGLDYVRVANAALYVALLHQQRINGTPALIEVLLRLADWYAARPSKNPQPSDARH